MRLEGFPQQVEWVLGVVKGAFALACEDAYQDLQPRAEAWGQGDKPESRASWEPAFDRGLRGCAG
jgi:hypothetical protein